MNNEELLKKYVNSRTLENLSDKTIKDDTDNINRFLIFLEGRDINEDTVLDYLNYIRQYTFLKNNKKQKYSKYTLYQIESKLRKFLTFLKNPAADLIHPRMPKGNKLPEDMLTEEEIEKLLNVCQTFRDKALISFLYESACRKGELFGLKIKNVRFDDLGAVVTFPEGKTGSRRIRIVFSATYLRQYIENRPNNSLNSFLFCSTRAPYNRLSNTGLHNQLCELAKRANIHKNIFPHLFRHSRCTKLAEHLTEQQLKKYVGWTAGSDMASVYVHLSGKDIDNAILKMNGIEIEDTYTTGLRVGRCPRCKELNTENSLYCGKCGLPLKVEAQEKINRDLAEIDLEIMKAISKDPTILTELAKELNKIQNNNKNSGL